MSIAPFLLRTIIFFQITKSFWMALKQWSQLIYCHKQLCSKLGINFLISGQKNKVEIKEKGGEEKNNEKAQHFKSQTLSFKLVSFNFCFCCTETNGINKIFARELILIEERRKPKASLIIFCPELEKVKSDVVCFFLFFVFNLTSYYHSSSKYWDYHRHFTWLPHMVIGLFLRHLWLKSVQLLWCC